MQMGSSEVHALLRGVFTKKPLQPRYAFTRDVQVVLDFVKNKWGNSYSFSDRDLTFKLVILLALTSAFRACTMQSLDIRFVAKHAHFVQFMFGKLHKGWKSGKSFSVVRYYEYEGDRDLCVQTTLHLYLERTKPWGTDQKKNFLLSYVNAHKGVCSSTISG